MRLRDEGLVRALQCLAPNSAPGSDLARASQLFGRPSRGRVAGTGRQMLAFALSGRLGDASAAPRRECPSTFVGNIGISPWLGLGELPLTPEPFLLRS